MLNEKSRPPSRTLGTKVKRQREGQGMSQAIFDRSIPIPQHVRPGRRWKLEDGQPTDRMIDHRRGSVVITPVPNPGKRGKSVDGTFPEFASDEAPTTKEHDKEPTPDVNESRSQFWSWRGLRNHPDSEEAPQPAELSRLLGEGDFQAVRRFFSQVEGVEAANWSKVAELAP